MLVALSVMKSERWSWMGPFLAASAFIVVLAAFITQLFFFQANVRAWAERDVQSRADLTARILAEPLRTLDMKAIRAVGDACREEELRLQIQPGFYDSSVDGDVPCLFKEAPCGDFRVAIGRPLALIHRPFLRALAVIALAGLLGMAGVVLFFVTNWRQRLKIRELAKLESFRREFIADVSHEIKTPLTGILGAADLLKEECSPASSRLVEMIVRESRRLQRLVQQILDLARLGHENVKIARERFDLALLVRDVVRDFSPRATSRGLALVVDAPAGIAPFVGDAALLTQALGNLIENAIRHSGASEVRVSLEIKGRSVSLAVEDNGCGVPPEHAARIFERFYRVDASRTADLGGSGLGLAIVRDIARLSGGDASYEPVVPRGSRFVLTFRAPNFDSQ